MACRSRARGPGTGRSPLHGVQTRSRPDLLSLELGVQTRSRSRSIPARPPPDNHFPDSIARRSTSPSSSLVCPYQRRPRSDVFVILLVVQGADRAVATRTRSGTSWPGRLGRQPWPLAAATSSTRTTSSPPTFRGCSISTASSTSSSLGQTPTPKRVFLVLKLTILIAECDIIDKLNFKLLLRSATSFDSSYCGCLQGTHECC